MGRSFGSGSPVPLTPSIEDQTLEDQTLLAIDAGVRETGWAIFQSEGLNSTGVIAVPGRGRVKGAVRVAHLIEGLDGLVAQWQPGAVACCQPSGINWSIPSLELLNSALCRWAPRHGLRLYNYSTQEVRSAIAGHPNASRDQLGYAIMVRLGLIGQGKTTHEWEAVAAGYYHRTRYPAEA